MVNGVSSSMCHGSGIGNETIPLSWSLARQIRILFYYAILGIGIAVTFVDCRSMMCGTWLVKR